MRGVFSPRAFFAHTKEEETAGGKHATTTTVRGCGWEEDVAPHPPQAAQARARRRPTRSSPEPGGGTSLESEVRKAADHATGLSGFASAALLVTWRQAKSQAQWLEASPK